LLEDVFKYSLSSIFFKYYNQPDERFLKNQQVLSDGVDKLKNVKKTAYEADNIGVNVMVELKSQTDKLEKAIKKVKNRA
jgi:hypothetical protein